LENTDVEVQLADVVGKLQATAKQLISTLDALNRQTELSEDERIRLFGQKDELVEQKKSLEEQQALLQKKKEKLKILSPIDGQVMLSWDVERSLQNRTVEPGQMLMSIADPTKDWELELFMPERRMGHIDLARKTMGDELPVRYILATDPDTNRDGRVRHIEEIAQVHGDEGNSVRVRVAINQKDISDPRPGSTVTAKLLCGRRSIGYTWFHEAVEWLQAKVFF